MKLKSHKEELIICKNCKIQLDKIVQAGYFSNKDITLLQNPARVINVNFPLLMDDGSTQIISGFRIQYNDALGPTKGGIRMHHQSDEEEVTELAFLMTLKTSLLGLPYGGGKGVIKVNPKKLSLNEKEKVVRAFGRAISKFIGSDFDIPAPDVNTGAQEMAWIREEYEKVVGHTDPAVVTGKAVENGGSLGREASTAQGGFYILKEHLKSYKVKPHTMKVAIQGFGNVGSNIAKLLHDVGFKIVSVGDSRTGLYNPSGLDIKELIRFKKNKGSFLERSEQKISNKKLLELPVDILIPSALGGVITKENASSVKAKIIVEMANAPILPEADLILKKKRITIIPDILSNAGGVVVSYFEWLQNKKKEKWSLEKVNKELKKHIILAYKKISKLADDKKITLRSASYLIAIKRILKAEKKRHNL